MSNPDVYVLRALARLNRRGVAATPSALALRAGGTPAEAVRALSRLVAAGFAYVAGEGDARLTLSGLAVAVSSARVRDAASKPSIEVTSIGSAHGRRKQSRAA